MWLSLFGFVACVVIMFLIDWISSLVTFGIVLALYMIVVYRKPDVNWVRGELLSSSDSDSSLLPLFYFTPQGSTTQAETYKTALTAALKLQNVTDHVKNFHPNLLVLTGPPIARAPLVDFANLITKNNSLMIVGNVEGAKMNYKERKATLEQGNKWLAARKIRAFYSVIDDITFEEGVRCLMQVSGFGKFSPNILLMGYKADWQTCNHRDLVTYFNILQ